MLSVDFTHMHQGYVTDLKKPQLADPEKIGKGITWIH